MDEAFLPVRALLPALLPHIPDLVDDGAGVRSRVTGYELSTPVELDVTVTADGVVLGSAPPLYHVETSLPPVLHQLRIVAVREEET